MIDKATTKPKPKSSRPAAQSRDDHYSATQLRSDRWSALQENAQLLFEASDAGKGIQRLREQTTQLLDTLEPIEQYWAFPGRAVMDHLRQLLAAKEFEELAFLVRRIVRATSSGAYRRRAIPLTCEPQEGEDLTEEEESPEARAYARRTTAPAALELHRYYLFLSQFHVSRQRRPATVTGQSGIGEVDLNNRRARAYGKNWHTIEVVGIAVRRVA